MREFRQGFLGGLVGFLCFACLQGFGIYQPPAALTSAQTAILAAFTESSGNISMASGKTLNVDNIADAAGTGAFTATYGATIPASQPLTLASTARLVVGTTNDGLYAEDSSGTGYLYQYLNGSKTTANYITPGYIAWGNYLASADIRAIGNLGGASVRNYALTGPATATYGLLFPETAALSTPAANSVAMYPDTTNSNLVIRWDDSTTTDIATHP